MGRPVVPVRSLSMRLPDAGRIRIGVKGSKGQPQKLDRFRFTSTDPAALQQVADLYGGTVGPWSDPKAGAGQHQVITEAREIRIALPPDPLGNTPIYELWSGGGCQRRCDGATCELQVAAKDGIDLDQVPCICLAKGELECKVTTRLSVLLPEIRFLGVWRLDTHGWNAAQELPGMVEVIRSLQDKGIVSGILRVEERVQVLAGQTRKYMVPVLGLDSSVEQLAAGMAQVGALGVGGTVPELGTGRQEGEDPAPSREGAATGTDDVACRPDVTSPSDDDVVDAELVDEPVRLVDMLPEGVTSGRALIAARQICESKGLAFPNSVEEVTDPAIVSATLDALGVGS